MSDNKKLSRHACRELIFKLLFAKEFDRGADPEAYYADYVENAEEPTADYVKQVFLGVCASLPALDEEGRPVGVLDVTDVVAFMPARKEEETPSGMLA